MLGQIDYELFNEGSDVIQNPDFTFTFPTESIVLDVLLTPEDAAAALKIEANKVMVRLPYINPVREHRQRLTLSILVDGNPAKVRVAGSGVGWSIRHQGLPSSNRDFLTDLGLILIGMGLIWAGSKYGGYVEVKYGIERSEISWRAFVWMIPFMAAVFAWGGIFVRHTYKSTLRRRQRWPRQRVTRNQSREQDII